MTWTYDVVDADGHILEPLDLWGKYIDPAFRERRPRFISVRLRSCGRPTTRIKRGSRVHLT
jgi:hypothetical protein